MKFNFESKVFVKEKVSYAGTEEYIVRGGRDLFPRLPTALEGIRQIAVIGWGSQGPAQAQNLRDSLSGSDIRVVVGLRSGSASWEKARAAGFDSATGTLLEMMKAIRTSDMVLLLISDAAQAALYRDLFDALKPGATLGLSHGFLLACLKMNGERFPTNINVIGVCPKGMGPSVRRLYEQGASINGAGINTSFAIEQDRDGRATDYALAWSVALGAPFSFMTSLEMEYRSDVFGERAILLGAVHGIVEALYRRFVGEEMSTEEAFRHSVESITGPISKIISSKGMIALYEQLSAAERVKFERIYNVAYPPIGELIREIYDEVESINEIRSVILSGRRLARYPMTTIDNTAMWRVGTGVRAARVEEAIPLDTVTAAIYLATMMAQVDLLLEKGHVYSEIVNESIIEAVDSLNPYMHYKGVSFMVDNCSTTARIGARKWAPRFDYLLYQTLFPALDAGLEPESAPMEGFKKHSVHEALAVLSRFRPSIDISVRG